MTDSDRKPRELRKHETYKEDQWTVVDITGVDKVFATETVDRYDEAVRIDLDGFGAQSVMDDLDLEGENINTSIWLPLPEAVELRDYLDEAIETARAEDSS